MELSYILNTGFRFIKGKYFPRFSFELLRSLIILPLGLVKLVELGFLTDWLLNYGVRVPLKLVNLIELCICTDTLVRYGGNSILGLMKLIELRFLTDRLLMNGIGVPSRLVKLIELCVYTDNLSLVIRATLIWLKLMRSWIVIIFLLTFPLSWISLDFLMFWSHAIYLVTIMSLILRYYISAQESFIKVNWTILAKQIK